MENNIIVEQSNNKNKSSNGLSLVIIILLLIVVICVLVATNRKMNTDIDKLQNEILNIKTVLKEYGVYIDKKDEPSSSYDTSVFEVINPSDIVNISKDNTIVLWVGRQSCGYCAMYAPYIKEAADNYGIKAYYVDLATLINFDVAQPYAINQDELDILSNLPGQGEWEKFAYNNVGGTPLTLVIKDSQVVGGLSGYADTNTVMQIFSDAGLMKN